MRSLPAWLLIPVLAAFLFGEAPAAFAQLDGLSITMDAPQYNVGDSGHFCYTVPGPGQVTITNNGVAGTTTMLSVQDGGGGACDAFTNIGGPPGNYCVVILFSGQAGVGTSQVCYQVTDTGSEN